MGWKRDAINRAAIVRLVNRVTAGDRSEMQFDDLRLKVDHKGIPLTETCVSGRQKLLAWFVAVGRRLKKVLRK